MNWRSYHNTPRAQPAANPEEYAPAPVPVARRRKQKQQQVYQQQPEAPAQKQNLNYKVFNKAPPQIMQILQFQQQIPYLNIIPQQFR